jgi:CRP/FNR family cyclic AMP-dependent transcriptional regulator
MSRSVGPGGRLDLTRFMDTSTAARTAEQAASMVFLGGLAEDEWAQVVERCERRLFAADEVVVRAGEVDRSLLILVAGALGIVLDPNGDGEPFDVIHAPSVVGEVAFLDGLERSGTLRAIEPGELLRLGFEDFEALAAEAPHIGQAILLDLGRILAMRLRRTNFSVTRPS